MTTMAVIIPAAGVRTPDLDFKAEREKEPVAGYAPKQDPIVFVTPIAISSWLGLILYPFKRPNAAMKAISQYTKSKNQNHIHFEIAMCSKRRIIVATGRLGPSAAMRSGSIDG
jgi:hypothetical protein